VNWRVWLLTAAVVLTNTIGNYALAVGMRNAPADAGPVLSLLEPAVLAGIVLLIVWTLLRLQLLKRADLTFVLPVTAVGYVLNAWMGATLLHEHVSVQRWAGTLLIVAGAGLTGVGAAKTEPPQ
jgi:uncharacterized membrane protein